MYVQQFFVEGLGCASYLVGSEVEGVAAIIDPDREVHKYLDAAQAKGFKITHIVETHLHADHVSGNVDLAAHTGADVYIHQAAQAGFPHKPLQEGDSLRLGDVRLDVRHTPGHTPESITLLATDTTRGDQPWLAFTGDTLFVGDIGRPDLVGGQAARDLAAMMYDSLFTKILPLDDSLLIYPGHGAGSLCGRAMGAMRSTTLGFERRYNFALASRSKEEFVEFATRDLPEQPSNFQRIKTINQRGPRPLADVTPRPLSIREAIAHFQRGAVLLDTRPKPEFVHKHIPGAIHLEADDQLSHRAGLVLPPGAPIVLMVSGESEAPAYRRAIYSLARVGHDTVVGYLAESLAAWEALGLPTTSGDIRDIGPDELHALLNAQGSERPVVIDVREPWEYANGHVPGAVLIPLGQLAARAGELDPEQPTVLICASGSRSQSAAALLGQKGFKTLYNVAGGTLEWAQSGLPIERGIATSERG